ncbi:MAG: uroporphyrinogen decarboxylase family protein [Planctomycetota bacterium]|nr:uroporphyrinogen decarboxylase family protein [Planctomycetota bacterium]
MSTSALPHNQQECTAQQRFLKTVHYQDSDRPPLWEEGIIDEVWEMWREQGLTSPDELRRRFQFDHYELIEPNLWPIPRFKQTEQGEFSELRGRYSGEIGERLPKDWAVRVNSWENREHPIGLMFTRGLLQACGVGNWQGLTGLLYALFDSPGEIDCVLECVTEMALTLVGKVIEEVHLDFAVLSEPIASFSAPVLSPDHYRRFAMPHYRRLVDSLKAKGIENLVVRTWGNSSPLFPLWLDLGINTLWNDHCNSGGVSYPELRRRFGKELRLIGGIDARALHKDKKAIHEAVDRTVPPLLESGGYLPMLDDRVRRDVPFKNYCCYRERLMELVEKG